MCTHATFTAAVDGSAKGPNGEWFHVTNATAYFDHPVHAMAGHTLNLDLADPSRGPAARLGIELTAESARAVLAAIVAALDAVPPGLAQLGEAARRTQLRCSVRRAWASSGSSTICPSTLATPPAATSVMVTWPAMEHSGLKFRAADAYTRLPCRSPIADRGSDEREVGRDRAFE
jgi:hypothetical protein